MNKVCRCCQKTVYSFDLDVVFREKAEYFKCLNCGSIQINNPTWLSKAYTTPIPDADSGLVFRCFNISRLMAIVLLLEKKFKQPALDWGGGYGLLTRILRDLGFQFYNYDLYVEGNLSLGFNLSKKELSDHIFRTISVIEVFEHLEDPVAALGSLSQCADLLFVSVELVPDREVIPSNRDWDYFQPSTGQHITFPTRQGLNEFSKLLGFAEAISIGNLHIFSKSKLRHSTRLAVSNKFIRRLAMLFIYDYLIKKQK